MSSFLAHAEQDPFGTTDSMVAAALLGAVVIVYLYFSSRRK